MTVVSCLEKPAALSAEDKAQMYALLARYYLGTRWEDFVRDLEEKEAVILLRAADRGPIVGFSTLLTLDLPDCGPGVRALFSGDTIVDTPYRSTSAIPCAIARYGLSLAEAAPGTTVYYLLISKGWRTYRGLATFLNEYYPRPGSKTPDKYRQVIEAFGRLKYPKLFDSTRGVIRATEEAARVRPGSPEDIPAWRFHPLISYFAKRNPGYLAGEELVCTGRLEWANFRPLLRKLLAPDLDGQRGLLVFAL